MSNSSTQSSVNDLSQSPYSALANVLTTLASQLNVLPTRERKLGYFVIAYPAIVVFVALAVSMLYTAPNKILGLFLFIICLPIFVFLGYAIFTRTKKTVKPIVTVEELRSELRDELKKAYDSISDVASKLDIIMDHINRLERSNPEAYTQIKELRTLLHNLYLDVQDKKASYGTAVQEFQELESYMQSIPRAASLVASTLDNYSTDKS